MWDDLSKNPIFWVVVAFTVFGFGILIMSDVVIKKTADEVIERLRQGEYSPSPYGPGIDPDKLDLDNVRASYPESMNYGPRESRIDYSRFESDQNQNQNNWSDEWEKDRGF